MKNFIMLLGWVLFAVPGWADQAVSGVEQNVPAAAIAQTRNIDVGGYKSLSIQVDYADATPSTITVLDGQFSSTTLTVVSYAGLIGTRSSATITLTSGKNTAAALTGAVINIKGKSYTEAIDWVRDVTWSTNTAANIAAAIGNSHDEYTATSSSNVILVMARSSGTAANAWAITSSTPAALTLDNALFSYGKIHGYLTINGTTLTEGTDFVAATSSHVTCNAIAVAINANATLSALVSVSSTSATAGVGIGVMTVSAKLSGVNAYLVGVSNISHLRPSEFTFFGGIASAIDVATNTITSAAHGFSLGLRTVLQNISGTAPTGLTLGTTYFIIPVDANSFRLATSAANALIPSAIDITAVAGGKTLYFAPIAFVKGSTGFDFRGSNDGITYYDLTGASVSSVTYAADGGILQNFPDYAYRYLQFKFTAPTSGGVNLNLVTSGRK